MMNADLFRYLELPTSRPLQRLFLNGCGLDSTDIARLFHALSKNNVHGQAHPSLHIDVSNSSIEGFSNVILAIQENHGPTSLAWKLLDFPEQCDFVTFIQALTENKVIQSLDLSQLFLDFHLDETVTTAMFDLFLRNDTLQEFNLSANNSRLDNSQLGPQFHSALLGLKTNTSLKILRIEDQAIGSEGAIALAEVLRENTTLCEVHCENNNINLANFTLLVDAMQSNHSVTFLSSMEHDKSRHVHHIESSIIKAARPKSQLGFHDINITQYEKENLPREVANAIVEAGTLVDEHWEFQRGRLEQILQRNRRLASGEISSSVLEDTDCVTAGAEDDNSGLPSLQEAISEYGIDG
jgi:hypothetical protein